jgi:hypothetical protein
MSEKVKVGKVSCERREGRERQKSTISISGRGKQHRDNR